MRTLPITDRRHLLRSGAVIGASLTLLPLFSGCATENHQALVTEQVQATRTAPRGPRVPVSVGKFDNRSSFMRGAFSDGVDRLGGQSRTILVGHLQQSGRFNVLDRDNLSETGQEARIAGQAQQLKAAEFVITGDVTEFGRKQTGDHQLFGILGKGKTQVAYAKVGLNVVRTATGEVVFAAQGAGEYSLSNREIVGFGGTASYDATLNGKVLDLAIREAVDRLVDGLESDLWQPPSRGGRP